MPGGIFIYRADTHDILYANDRFLALLGYDSLESLTQSRGHTFDDILSASDKERVFLEIEHQLRQSLIGFVDLKAITKTVLSDTWRFFAVPPHFRTMDM